MNPAIRGSGFGLARSLAFAYTTSALANSFAIVAGDYYVVATTDCWAMAFGSANTSKISALPTSTQPAIGSENKAFFCPAGVPVGVSLTADTFISAIAVTSSGTLSVTGPVHNNNSNR